MQKEVMYFATRNIYENLLPSLKSLLKNGNVDRVWLLIEDSDIGFDLPGKVVCRNIRNWKRWIDPNSPNAGNRWSYMVMLKVLTCRMFPKMHRALTLDVDTIVRGDLSPLWELPMEDLYFYGAREPYWTDRYGRDYVNAGVLMLNLDKMRDGMADLVFAAMNTRKYTFVEQDALNEICAGKFGIMDAAYNAGEWTEPPKSEIRIRHYMARRGKYMQEAEMQEYSKMNWEEFF